MNSVMLVYPYFKPAKDRSVFRFPPLGIGYVGASLRNAGHKVETLDCTFSERDDALKNALNSDADVVGIYCMASMKEDSLRFARALRNKNRLIIAGGPLPSSDPLSFMEDFDIVVKGEGEHALPELLEAYQDKNGLNSVLGIFYHKNGNGQKNRENGITFTGPRPQTADLDTITFPARDLLPNFKYLDYWKKKTGRATTSIMTTRGCPFTCEFCSNAVFGVSYRERSPQNVVDEVEEVLSYGFDRIHFADDVFTLKKERVTRICQEIKRRKLNFKWECLGRVDSIDLDLAKMMKDTGCDRIFFGIESANDSILKLMNKKITISKVRQAIEAANNAGINTGGFFILCYPGETNETVLNTIRFSTSLPLDYLSFTVPYPLPGTALYERMKNNITREWKAPSNPISDHCLIFRSDFSQFKMRFAILKGQAQFWLRKRLKGYGIFILKPIEVFTDIVFKLLK
jgi:anaerobic magnesium-protoporphyrin IX monomethyl ester cyclase